MKTEIYDSIYCTTYEARKLLESYPDAVTKDASDFVHENRFTIELEDTRKNYYKNLITSGVSDNSLSFQLALKTEEDFPMISEIVKELSNHLMN